jgi:hypothetical protein
MESQVSPKNIESRVEKMAAENAAKAIETPVVPAAMPVEPVKPAEPAKPEAAKPAEPAKPEPVKPAEPAKPEAVKPAEPVKPTEPIKPVEKKQPNDPLELRKWATKVSQENAKLADEMKGLKAAIEKLSKKPVDYAELAKNPEGLKAHIEAERQEAVKELTAKYIEARDTAVANETRLIRMEMEQDTENFPRFKRLFPLIQTLANNNDGRVNWNQAPRIVLEEAYALAEQLSPAEVAAAVAAPDPAPAVPAAPVVPVVTEEQIQARIAEAVAKAKTETETNLRAEMNGGGIGGLGKGGHRDTKVSNDALKKMPLKDLKALISKE